MSAAPPLVAGATPQKPKRAIAPRGRGPLSRLFLTWVFPLLRLGIQRPLRDDEHLELPAGADAETGVQNFWAHHRPGTSVLLTLWKVHRRSLLLCVAAGCTGIVAKLCSTLLVRAIAALLLSPDADIRRGVAYAAGLWACSCIDALTLTHGNLILGQCALGVYSTFAGVTYGKSKSLHPFVKPKHKRGSLINLALSETGRVIESSLILLAGCVAPLQLVGSLVVALALFGPEVLVMVIWIVAVTVALRWISKKQADKFRQKMIFQSQRISTCNEMLQAIRMVKFGAWEEQFEGLLNGSRRQEEKALFQMRILHGLGNPVCNVLPVVASLSIFGIHIALHGHMPAIPDVFALIQILRAISIPFTFMGVTLSSIETLFASAKRLTDLIAEPDLVRREVVSAAAPAGMSVSVQHASFKWTEGEATLKDVCLEVPRGQLVFVVGHLGQGKSSLMGALLGEMALADGASEGGCGPTCCVDAAGGLAYAPQQAFVMNASVRDNVLFGRPFEEERYHAALHAAALDLDLELLPAGDETEIGEKGVTLSGGQRARVGLARVAYANAGLSLLDDPFAALDMEVGRHVFDHLLCGSLAKSARLVASSQLHMLEDPRVDRILVLDKGRIVEDGTFAELSHKGTVFSELIQYSGMSSGHAQKPKEAASKEKADAQPQAAKTPAGRPSVGSNARMTVDETKREGAVSFSTLKLYCRFVGSNLNVAFLIVLIWLFSIGEYSPDIWLSVWQEDLLGASLDFYMGIWAAILILGVVVMVVSRVGCAVASARAATNIHGAVLHSLVQCPMSFFEQTPSGRILNRFGEDQFVMDVPLGMLLEAVVIIVLKAINSLVVILVSVPWVGIAVVIILPAFRQLWAYQRATIIEATRFHLVSKSPMFNTFEETLSGLPTLQAFGMEDRFLAKFHGAINHNISWLWTKMVAQTWSEQGLMLLVSVIVATAAVCIVLMRDTVLPSAAALGLIYVILLAEFLRFIFGMSAQAESSLAVIERAQELLQTTHEAARKLPSDGTVTVAKSDASVVFKNVVMRYRPHLDPALNDVSFAIAPGERVGIVGRSGSGKSTLLTALLRLVEISSGEIYIGRHNTADMGLRLLRQLVTIIPQEPVMFSGSLRWNLDPTSSFDDADVRKASARCGIVDMRPTFSLDEEVKENGSNFSVGERQLICFARALLRSNAVMLFDEATASIDVENDARLQRVLRADFKGSTILTVAHRLGTIADSDKILALSKGRVAEFDTPAKLIQRGDGVFASLAREAGLSLPSDRSNEPCEPPAEKVGKDEIGLEVRRGGPLCLQDIVLRMGHLCH